MFLGAWLAASGGCNCLIDADKYRGGPSGDGGGMDGAENLPDGTSPPDGRIESDAGPIEPTSAREGEGSGTGAPPVVIVLRGREFEPDATASVVRSGDDTDLVDGPAVVATDGSMIAIPIRIPIYDDLDETETTSLEISVDGVLVDTLVVEGLLEADLAGTVDTTMLRPLYSSITTTANVTFAGASPAILRSASDITITNVIDGSGEESTDGVSGGVPGPGGCAGGDVHLAGQCSIGGGEPGGTQVTTGTGGGGGGHATNGTGGASGGDGGQMTGSEFLVPLDQDGGNGGGGGGDGTTGSQGAGGGGGGAIELSAVGRVRVGAVVSANGGAGTDGDGALPATAEGSGGGGSGGGILVRAISVTGAGSLNATGAAGGMAFNVGGAGANGRIRIDVATPSLPGVSVDPAPIRGPHWADDTESIVRDADFTATLYGEPNRTFAANIDGSDPEDVATNGSGTGNYPVTLEPGHNRICAIVSPTQLTLPEAVRCLIVTFVP